MRHERAFIAAEPETVVDAVREAVQTFAKSPNSSLAQALVDLYGAVLRLTGPAQHIQALIGGSATENLTLSVDEQAAFLRFFDLIKDFDERLSEADIGALHIYQPGLVEALLDVTGLDYNVEYYFNTVLAPRHGLEPTRLPAGLNHFLANYSGDYGYKSEVQVSALKQEFLGGRWNPWATEVPESALKGDVDVDGEKLGRLDRLCDAFLEVRSLLAILVRDNWTLAELAEARKLPIEVVMGDQFRNISNTTIVNRSILENSFLKLEQDDPAVAQALRQVAARVESSGSEGAGQLFDAFNSELQEPTPKKPVLASLWSGIVTAVPTLREMTDVVARISTLF